MPPRRRPSASLTIRLRAWISRARRGVTCGLTAAGAVMAGLGSIALGPVDAGAQTGTEFFACSTTHQEPR